MKGCRTCDRLERRVKSARSAAGVCECDSWPCHHSILDSLIKDFAAVVAEREGSPETVMYLMYVCRENCGYATNVRADAEKHAEKHPLGWPWEPRFFVERPEGR